MLWTLNKEFCTYFLRYIRASFSENLLAGKNTSIAGKVKVEEVYDTTKNHNGLKFKTLCSGNILLKVKGEA